MVLFGLFLLIQTASLRLEFEERVVVWQNGRELRPLYDQWMTWRPLPAASLFYFRETQSIRLPICSARSSCGNNWSCAWWLEVP